MSRLLLAVVIVLGLVVAGFVSLLVLLDNPEAYKEKLSDSFEAQTGYGLQIDGSVDWQYFPPVAIALNKVAVTIPDSDTPLASLNSASIDLKVWPLIFGGAVEVSGLSVDGLTINASVDVNGKGNWEVAEQEQNTGSDTQSSATSSNGNNDLTVDIGGISITNTVINYQDLASNSDYVIQLERLITGPLGTGITTDIEATLKFEDKAAGMTVNTQVDGKAAINETLDEFLLEGLKIASTIKQTGAPELKPVLVFNGKLNTTSEVANLTNSSLNVGGMTLNMDLDVTEVFGTTKINGKISAPTFDAKQLLIALDADPGEMNNPKAMSQVTIDSNIKGTLEKIALENFKLGLDASTLTGNVNIGLGTLISLGFDLVIDSINASDYSAATASEGETTGTSAVASIEDSEILPLSTLRETNINGSFAITNAQYDSWQASDLKLGIKNQGSTLTIKGSAKAYDGAIKLNVTSRYPTATAKTTSNFTVTGVDIAKALETTSLTGTIELDANHSFNGHMMSDLTKSLGGQSTFNIANGTLDVSPIKQLAAIVDGIQGTQSGIAEWPDLLPFKSLNGDHAFKAGMKDNQSFNAALENMRIKGTGGIDYFANTMAYNIEATLLENVGGQFTVKPSLANVKWPLSCSGSLDADPMSLCFPDRSAITKLIADLAAQKLKQKGRDALQKKIDEKVPDELKDAAKGLLKGLFGN